MVSESKITYQVDNLAAWLTHAKVCNKCHTKLARSHWSNSHMATSERHAVGIEVVLQVPTLLQRSRSVMLLIWHFVCQVMPESSNGPCDDMMQKLMMPGRHVLLTWISCRLCGHKLRTQKYCLLESHLAAITSQPAWGNRIAEYVFHYQNLSWI